MRYEIVGARGHVENPERVLQRAAGWASEHGIDVLLADAQAVFGKDHMESAIRHAQRAKVSDRMTAKSVAMETLVYLAGRRQVADAIRVAGLRRGTEEMAVVGFGDAEIDKLLDALGWTREDDVLSAAGKSLSALGITRTASRTVPEDRRQDLALERTALVDVLL